VGPDSTPTVAQQAELAARTSREALESLRERAAKLRAERLRQAAALSEQIDSEIERIAELVAQERDRDRETAFEAEQRAGATQLETAQAALAAERTDWEERHTALQDELAEREARLAAEQDALSAAQQALAAEQTEQHRHREELQGHAAELAAQRTELDALQADLDAALVEAAAETEQQEQRIRDLEEQLAASLDARAEAAGRVDDAQRLADELAQSQETLAATQSDADKLREALEAAEQALQATREAGAQGASDAQVEIARLTDSLALAEAAGQAAVEAVRTEAATQREALLAEHTAQREQWEAERAQWLADREALDDATRRLAEQETGTLALAAERDTLNAQVQELLATAPAGPDPAILAQLAAVETERDRLADRLAELEQQSGAGAPRSQDWADLERRYELVLGDLKQLKAEKEELAAKLAATPVAAPVDTNDWEAQKRRLLASLGEAEDDSPSDAQERATIDSTIRMTDEVVAAKEREIAQLREQLANLNTSRDDAQVVALLDHDELILAERKRLAELQQEWEEKLRTAELELSVERAKIAREQSELAEWRMELETLRDSLPSTAGGESKRRRRWLDQLGLGGGD
jgi:chromosome segregation ATPase